VKKALHITTRIFLWLLATIAAVVLLVVVAIQFKAVQQKLIHTATSYISDKTHTRVEVGRLAISFPKNIVLENVFVEDLQHDTLLSVQELSVGADMFALFKGKIAVSDVSLSGVTSRIHRTLPDSAFNFDFLINVFASGEKSREIDTSQGSSPGISVGSIRLNDIRFTYDDQVIGIFTENTIGELTLSIESIDLNRLSFAIDELRLANSSSRVKLSPVPATKPETNDTSALPYFSARKIVFESVDFVLNDPGDSLFFKTRIGVLELYPNAVDLNKQLVDIRSIELLDSKTEMEMIAAAETNNNVVADSTPGWSVAVDDVSFNKNAFSYDVTNTPGLAKGFDYNHINATGINIEARSLAYSDSGIKGDIRQLMVNEQGGISVQKFRTKFSYDDRHAELANLYLQTSRSKITNYLYVAYPSIEQISKQPGAVDLNLHFVNTKVDMQDVLVFVPELATDSLFRKNTRQQVVVNGRIKGKLSDLQLTDLIVQTGTQTAITVEGKVKGLPDADKLWVDLAMPAFTTSRADLNVLVPDGIIPSSVQPPEKIMIKGQVTGGLKDIRTNLAVHTSDGALNLHALYRMDDTVPVYDLAVHPSQLDIGTIIKEPMIGKVTGDLEVKGRSFEPKQMVTKVSGKFSLIELNHYGYKGLTLNADANNGLIQSQLKVEDSNIDLSMNLDGSVRTDESYLRLLVSLDGANLRNLKLTHDEYKVSGEVRANLDHIFDNRLKGNIGIGDVVVIDSKEKYELDSLVVISINEKRKVKESNAVVKADYNGHTRVEQIPDVIEHCISHYWGKSMSDMDLAKESFSCAIHIAPHPILTYLLVPELKQFSGIDIDIDYSGRTNAITVIAEAPLVEYDGTTLKNFALDINCKNDSLLYVTSLRSISGSGYYIDQTSVTGSIAHQQLRYDLKVVNPGNGYKLRVAGDIRQHGDSTVLRWLNEQMILNNEQWNIHKQNRIVIHQNGIHVQQFNLTHQQQFLKINSQEPQLNAPLKIEFGNFDLATVSQIVEQDTALIEGFLNGKIELNPADKLAFTSDLDIRKIVVKNIPVGDVFVNASSTNGSRYNAKVRLTGNGNDATVDGFYEHEALSFKVNIREIQMRSVEAFIPQTIKRSEGYITGNIAITGKADKPVFNGDIALKEASFNVAFINSRLSFNDEHVLLNNEGIRFKEFTVLDSMQQPLVMNGFIHTTNFVNMQYDLHITTRNFRVLNTTAKDNPEYYGTILLNSNIRVRGTEKLPKVDADVKLIDGSDITYVVQQGELSIDKGEGVVMFIDTSVNAIMKDTTTPMVSSFVGLDITANIEVNRNTKFKIITDANSGDNLVVSGDAQLSFGIDESGKISLVGAYVLSSGSYKASLQKIAKREFEIKSGSTITWSGDPLDAVIDITATYKVRTGATDLMAVELAGMDEGVRNQYRKLLNYNVDLIMKGFLTKPDLTFHLDMAPKDQLAFNGEIYAKVNQINNNPVELNKQVFSLLIWNKFIPMGTGSNMTATDAASTLARNSVNQLFSDQLNALSGKYVKGAELNFNIQANDDYTTTGTTQQNTEVQIGLRKELFNSRVSVQVGGNIDVGAAASQGQAQTVTGDMVMEYKITEDGAYRFKAFTENSYEGIIDGQIYKTGIGFLYSKDFDSLSQLFARPKKEETLKPKDEKAD
jgi:hypothetical protein